ncbi:type VI secretion system lipoprotein TssJ [Vibrio sp. SM6]|uniref:Type VI secretion system lipoprotein TssJ n=2 Tax=Vibrio agarilyticus TaxID=2726741 RepID=A0A7X8TPE8_9VIBR|nr:type VI secretion system lipoprotein TssJ [Vibrio agarilyticus]
MGWMIAGLSGCSSNREVVFSPSTPVSVHIQASKDINTFADQKPRPLIVRLYQLRESGAFENGDFVTLYQGDTQVLADSLIDSKVIPAVVPGELRNFTLEVHQETKFIAVLAEFAAYQSAGTKAVVPLVENPDENPVLIQISHAKIEISQPVDSSWLW